MARRPAAAPERKHELATIGAQAVFELVRNYCELAAYVGTYFESPCWFEARALAAALTGCDPTSIRVDLVRDARGLVLDSMPRQFAADEIHPCFEVWTIRKGPGAVSDRAVWWTPKPAAAAKGKRKTNPTWPLPPADKGKQL